MSPVWWHMRKLRIFGKQVKRSHIDDSVSERDPDFLANLIRAEDLNAEVKEHLAHVIFELLTGKKKFPAHRPKKKDADRQARWIAEEVVRIHRYRPEWAKLTAAVKKVAQDQGCGESKVWGALKDHRVGALIRLEEAEYDAMVDAAYEAEWKEAVEHLKEEHGDREFSDEEVHDEIAEMRSAYHDLDPELDPDD